MINILIKDIRTNKIEKTIPCDNRRQAEILIKHITFDKDKYYSETEEYNKRDEIR